MNFILTDLQEFKNTWKVTPKFFFNIPPSPCLYLLWFVGSHTLPSSCSLTNVITGILYATGNCIDCFVHQHQYRILPISLEDDTTDRRVMTIDDNTQYPLIIHGWSPDMWASKYPQIKMLNAIRPAWPISVCHSTKYSGQYTWYNCNMLDRNV